MIEVCYMLDDMKIVKAYETLGQANRAARRGSFGLQMVIRINGLVAGFYLDGNAYNRVGVAVSEVK